MAKIKNLWKNNKILMLFIIVILLILIVLFSMIFPLYITRSGSDYGDRLDGIKEVAIKNSTSNEIEDYFKSTEKVKKVTTLLKGRIYNIIVTVNDDVDVNHIANASNDALSKLDENQLKFYDIQIFIKNESDDNSKTIIGYKNKNTEGFIWTDNR